MSALTKLLITDITIMGPAFCVIGLQREGTSFRSIRPLPPRGNGWQQFPHERGDVLRFLLSTGLTDGPHREDRFSTGILGTEKKVPEGDVVRFLRKAEFSENLSDLFGCAVHQNWRGCGIYVEPEQASRSICGCEFQNIRFRLFPDAVRVTLLLSSGEALRDLPVVDRDWNRFIEKVVKEISGANRLQRVKQFLNRVLEKKLLNDPTRLARIGLTRLHGEKHWLMLDSLFPSPQTPWLSELT